MPLTNASANAVLDAWSVAAGAPFLQAERQTLRSLLVRLSAAVLPHIVDDAPLTDTQSDAYIMERTICFAEDWLLRVAAPMRRAFDRDGVQYETKTASPSMGMRSATYHELEALPVLGPKLARDTATFLANNPQADFDDLTQVNGIGPAGLNTLADVAYLDQARPGLVSASVWGFANAPGFHTLIAVFSTSDLQIVYGDAHTVQRRLNNGVSASVAMRLEAVLDIIVQTAEATSFAAGGVLASEVLAWNSRTKTYDDLLASVRTGTGEILVNDAYVDTVKNAIAAAQTSVSLMVFLGTTAQSIGGGPSPDMLIDTLEAVAGRAQVRVILDQDDDGEPYKSALINRPLFDRLKGAGIPVKFDEKNVLLHSKVVVIDQKTVVVGSHNWTRSGFNGTYELSILTNQPTLAAAYEERFDVLWNALPHA